MNNATLALDENIPLVPLKTKIVMMIRMMMMKMIMMIKIPKILVE